MITFEDGIYSVSSFGDYFLGDVVYFVLSCISFIILEAKERCFVAVRTRTEPGSRLLNSKVCEMIYITPTCVNSARECDGAVVDLQPYLRRYVTVSTSFARCA